MLDYCKNNKAYRSAFTAKVADKSYTGSCGEGVIMNKPNGAR